jgi:hypothetical protein
MHDNAYILESDPHGSEPTKTLFGCSRICINLHVLGWIELELELNFTPIYPNICGLS